MGADPVDAAIEAIADKTEIAETRVRGAVKLESGRRVEISVPIGMTDTDWGELQSRLWSEARPTLRAAQPAPGPRLLVPRHS